MARSSNTRVAVSKGFTLVELLVVIGIIGLLISILLPVLNKAREQARSIVCANQEKQLLLAFAMYVSEHKAATPIFPPVGSGFPPAVNDGYFNSLAYYMDTTTPGRGGVIRYDVGAFWTYLSQGLNTNVVPGATKQPAPSVLNRTMVCPSDQEGLVAGNGTIDWSASQFHNFSYSWNGSFWIGDPPSNTKPNLYSSDAHAVSKVTMIRESAHKIILSEEAHPNDGWSFVGWPGTNNDDTPTQRHLGRGNWGYADGHVESMLPGDLGYVTVKTLGDIATVQDYKLAAYLFRLQSNVPN